MPKFNDGARVRDITTGNIGTVVISEWIGGDVYRYFIAWDGGTVPSMWIEEDLLELYTGQEDPTPVFKIGDRVRNTLSNKIGFVTDVQELGETFGYLVDWVDPGFPTTWVAEQQLEKAIDTMPPPGGSEVRTGIALGLAGMLAAAFLMPLLVSR